MSISLPSAATHMQHPSNHTNTHIKLGKNSMFAPCLIRSGVCVCVLDWVCWFVSGLSHLPADPPWNLPSLSFTCTNTRVRTLGEGPETVTTRFMLISGTDPRGHRGSVVSSFSSQQRRSSVWVQQSAEIFQCEVFVASLCLLQFLPQFKPHKSVEQQILKFRLEWL